MHTCFNKLAITIAGLSKTLLSTWDMSLNISYMLTGDRYEKRGEKTKKERKKKKITILVKEKEKYHSDVRVP